MLTTVCVRISKEEKREFLKHGGLSQTMREAVKLYLKSKKSDDAFSKLKELQARNPDSNDNQADSEMSPKTNAPTAAIFRKENAFSNTYQTGLGRIRCLFL